MFIKYIKPAFRNLLKYKSFSLINIIGLTLGLSSVMVLAFMLYQFVTTNSQLTKQERMYSISSKTADKTYNQTPFPFLSEVLRTCPEVEAGTHMQSWSWPWLKNKDAEFKESTSYVDTSFFTVFTYPLEYGNASTAFRDKNSVVLSHEMAQKLFPNEKAIGKIIIADDSVQLTVTGVLKSIPSNTTFRPEVLLTTALLNDNKEFRQIADWYNSFAENYLLLKPGADLNKINKQLNQVAQSFYHPDHKKNQLALIPFKDFVKSETGDITQVIVKGAIGTICFILLIMIANLINLNAATMLGRAKEVGLKKILGSSKRQIVLQFCVENALIVFVSLFLAFLLFKFLLVPQVNTIMQARFGSMLPDIHHDYPLGLWFVAGSIFIVIIAASYPAFHLTKLKVTDTLKGKIAVTNKKHYTRNIFITVQFVLAITLIGGTIILGRQINHMKSASLGFNKDEVLVIPMNLAFRNEEAAHARFDVMLNKLRSNPYVKNISTSEVVPTAYPNYSNTFYSPSSTTRLNMRWAIADAGLLPTYQIKLIEGRNFNNVPENQEHNNVIINKAAMKAFGWKSAVGKQIKSLGGDETLTVIGVMDDFHYLDLSRNIEPLIHRYGGEQQLGYTYLSIRIDPTHTSTILKQLQEEFKAMPSRRQFSYEFMDNKVDKQYALLNGILKAIGYFSSLTLFIAVMGLFGLVALFSQQRVKEIGIRRVLGANMVTIFRMLSQNYAVLIMVASLVAAPLTWIIMTKWLQDFAYRISIGWWTPLLAGSVALLLALSVVLFQALKSAVENPVTSLRNE